MSNYHGSPERPQSPLKGFSQTEETSELYKVAMSKLYESAWRFDRSKNEDLMKTLDNRELTKVQFRTILRSGMNCKISDIELEELMPLFDNNGNVDGCEFILLFYRLRYEYRSKQLTDRIAKDKRARDSQKFNQVKQLESQEQKVHISLTDDYTDADFESCMKKIIDAAVKYDRLMPGAVQLDAFECEFMTPHVFREQMRMVFNVQLSLQELAAFIRNFNKDQSHGDNVNCAAFIVKFFRMGFHEKSRRLRAVWAEKKRIQEEKERRRREEQAELQAKNSLKVSMKFTPEDKERAVTKLRNAARLYDKTTPGAMSMKSFEVKEMPPHVFKEQLKRIFNLNVNPAEMGALMAVFDVNGDGTITCEEFTKVFLNMGFEEREKELRDAVEKQKRTDQARLEEAQRKEEELANKNTLKVSYAYTPDEFQSAIHKLLEAAWRYDKNMPGAPCLDAFESQYMEPHVLKEQLRRAFYMKVTPQELGALMHYFDPEGLGKINCSNFLKKFFKTGYEERNRKQQQWRQHQKQVSIHKEKLAQLKQAEADNKLALNQSDSSAYTEADFQTAFAKLTEGAIKYNKAGAGAVGLDAFEAISMPPHIFKEQLKLVFNVKITIPELWALVAHFDKDQSGVINCKHFINQFLRTGFEERDRIRIGWRTEQRRKREKDEQKEEQLLLETQRKAYAEVDFDFLESDFDSALAKFVHICHQFDRRQLGPAGFAAFDAETLNPAEFRETMKRTFNLKVTGRELGALVTYFDVASKKVVNCSAFLNSFVQLRMHCEEAKGKPDEALRVSELQLQLKEAYQTKVSRQTSVDAKPWRQNNAAPLNGTARKVPKRRDAQPPSTAVEKYKLRVMVGRRTGRMDLASREVWTEPSSENKPSTAPSSKESSDGQSSLQQSHEGTSEAKAGSSESSDDHQQTGDVPSASEEADKLQEEAERQQQLDEAEEAVMFGAEGEPDTALVLSKRDGPEAPPLVDFRLNIIPSEVLRLHELTELWLCNNMISTIPSSIGDLKQLKVLSFTNNRLERLPPEVCQLENLRTLHLKGNKLCNLPNLLGRLRQLQEINLSRNSFVDFPEVLTSLSQLVVLDLSTNSLAAQLPPSLTEMRSLTLLNLEGNHFSAPSTVLARTPWIDVKGCAIPVSKKACKEFGVTPDEEFELMGMLKNRASVAIATNLRRKKLRGVSAK